MGGGGGGKRLLGIALAAAVGGSAIQEARAGRICDSVPQQPPSYAGRIATLACAENALWYGPFIDGDGRLASLTVAETENMRLRDSAMPAWRRVADYWKGSGLLWQSSHRPGARDCSYGEGGYLQASACRAFLTDTPWSAVFVSFVMNRAGVPGFHGSASHIDYVRDAFRRPDANPYLFMDPDTTPPARGDLLCFARMRNVLGYAGMRAFLESGSGDGLNMHCDIVVAADPGGDKKLYLVGGNVLQGVTMRVLPLNRKGLIWGLPRRTGPTSDCQPDYPANCSFNRQDWVALLKLRTLPAPVTPMSAPPVQPADKPCCTLCPLPMPPDVQRCAAPPKPAEPAPRPGAGDE